MKKVTIKSKVEQAYNKLKETNNPWEINTSRFINFCSYEYGLGVNATTVERYLRQFKAKDSSDTQHKN